MLKYKSHKVGRSRLQRKEWHPADIADARKKFIKNRRARGGSAAVADYQGYHGEPMVKKSRGSSVKHKIKGPDRGIINVIAAPKTAKFVHPEKSVIMGMQQITFSSVRDNTGGVGEGNAVNIANYELNPAVWYNRTDNARAPIGLAPIKGTGKGEMIKNEINVHSWKIRIQTKIPDAELSGHYSYRLVIMQILDDEKDVVATGGSGYLWNTFFQDFAPEAYFLSKNAATSAVSLAHRYKVVLDHYWPNMTKDHYEEITLGPHVQKYDNARSNIKTDFPVAGRFICFAACISDVYSNNKNIGTLYMTHRMTYSDE